MRPSSSRLPGSTGMPKCRISPPRALDRRPGSRRAGRRWPRRRAPGSGRSRASRSAAMARRDGGSVVVADDRRGRASRRARRAARAWSSSVLSSTLSLSAGQPRLDQARRDAARTARRGAAAVPRRRSPRSAATAASGAAKGMILTVATIWRGSTSAKGGSGRDGDRLVDQVEAVDARARRPPRRRAPRRTGCTRPVKAALATQALRRRPRARDRSPAAASSRHVVRRRAARAIDVRRCRPPRAPRRPRRVSTRPFLKASPRRRARACARIAPCGARRAGNCAESSCRAPPLAAHLR